MDIEVSSAVLESLPVMAEFSHPQECCGILFGSAGRVESFLPATNVHKSPESCFEIDPHALVVAHRSAREDGPPIAGYYHSHPNGLAEPSTTDRAQAPRDGYIWAIVAGGDVTFWRDGEAGFEPLSYRVVQA